MEVALPIGTTAGRVARQAAGSREAGSEAVHGLREGRVSALGRHYHNGKQIGYARKADFVYADERRSAYSMAGVGSNSCVTVLTSKPSVSSVV